MRREIVEFVQRGAARAEDGDQVIDLIAQRLQARVGRGYSSTNLTYFRIFYQVYAARAPVIRHEARNESNQGQPVWVELVTSLVTNCPRTCRGSRAG